MLFNSVDFAIFLPVVFFLYWFVLEKKIKSQNLLVVAASYVFYGWWDWRFLSLIIFSTIVDYFVARRIQYTDSKSARKVLLWISILVNLGFLGFFKYYNFFADNFVEAFSFFGVMLEVDNLNIVLPVGISFYTFQTMSYTIDVYRKKLEATEDFIAFSAFVSFFPQLVAGPIERATHLLPQFYDKRSFDYSKAVDGARQILWGFFKKIVIADNCAEIVNQVFSNSSEMNSSSLILGAIFFSFQIYGDFSGYSDIAIGTSRLFGFDLMRNFAFPYFSRDIAEFWRRWHISLSTWFRDYLYIPIGGSRGDLSMKIRNTFIIFLVSGFWHGANWTFIFWGGLNAIYFLPLLLTDNNRKNLNIVAEDRIFPHFKEFFAILKTYLLTVFAWIFFRAESLEHAFEYVIGIFSNSIFQYPNIASPEVKGLMLILIIFIVFEWFGRQSSYAIQNMVSRLRIINYLLVLVLLSCIYFYGNFNSSYEFIYFQF